MILDETPEPFPPRDRNGWPIIPLPGSTGVELKAFRPSGLSDALEDKFGLQQWASRVRMIGAGRLPSLAAQAAPLDPTGDRSELDGLAEAAFQAGGGGEKAGLGTSMHSWLERLTLDPDGTLSKAPENAVADLAAIAQCLSDNNIRVYEAPERRWDNNITEDEIPRRRWVEPFVITPLPGAHWAAGSPDMIANVHGSEKPSIVDLKTGRDPRQAPMSPAIQLAVYAYAEWAWWAKDEPLQWTPEMQRGVGYILHAPFGTGTCELVELNLEEGWEAACLATEVRAARRDMKRFYTFPEEPIELTDFQKQMIDIADGEYSETEQAVDDLKRRLAAMTALPPEGPGIKKRAITNVWPETPGLNDPEEHTPDTIADTTTFVELMEERHGMNEAWPALVRVARERAAAVGGDLDSLLDSTGLQPPIMQWHLNFLEPAIQAGEKRRPTLGSVTNKESKE
jgi:hypothetical protein